MSTAIEEPRHAETTVATVEPTPVVVAVKRRTIDKVLIGFGAVATAVFLVAGGLLTWGHNFSSDYVTKELSSQNVSFPRRRRPDHRGPHRPAPLRRPAPRHAATRPRPTPATSTATSPRSPAAPPTPTSALPRAQPRPP